MLIAIQRFFPIADTGKTCCCFGSIYEENNPFFRIVGAVDVGSRFFGYRVRIPARYRDPLSRMRNYQSLYSVPSGACSGCVLLSPAVLADSNFVGSNGAERRKNVSV